MRLLLSLSIALTSALAAHADDFPKPFNTGNDVGKKPMPASEAVNLIEMPPGFKATVFAAEPDVQNPIACTWDSRGRLWVAENYTYADAKTNFDKTLRDRILIFEDTDGDGVADKRTVFCDNLQNLTSIELGYGGLYATTAPRLVFIPIKDGEDKPAGEPVTLLDGFDAWGVRHNIVNGLKWGPDGWLYGRHGIQATSHVGAPGTPDKDRVAINCCIWRYHPVRKTFEVVMWGGTNSWGHDWNAEGDGFCINTVIGQLYQIIPGAHYERMYGQDLNPYIYQLLPQTADHYHFDTSKGWTNSRDGKANDLGGGHAHSGCMIYQGDNWPEQYRNKLYTLNLHGRRINCERLEKQGSGYVAKHEPDMIKFGDPWFRGVELTCGPDGGVYVLDWSDDGECHESDGVHRESGRIYKITYGTPKKADLGPKGDLAALSNDALVSLAIEGGEWPSRVARRLLAERGPAALEKTKPKDPPPSGAGTDAEQTVRKLLARLEKEENPPAVLRLMWTAHAMTFGAAKENHLGEVFRKALYDYPLSKGQEQERAWAIRLISDWWADYSDDSFRASVLNIEDPEFLQRRNQTLLSDPLTASPELSQWLRALANLGHTSESPRLRLTLASVVGTMPQFGRWYLATALFETDRDKSDRLTTSVLWSSLMATGRPPDTRYYPTERALLSPLSSYGGNIHLPAIAEFSARALASRILVFPGKNSKVSTEVRGLESLLKGITKSGNQDLLVSTVHGLRAGLLGIPKAPKPEEWDAFAAKASEIVELQDNIRQLNVIFGDGRALGEIRAIALDGKADFRSRRQALESLVSTNPPDLRTVLDALVKDGDLLPDVLVALSKYDDTGPIIAGSYNRVRAERRPEVIAVLCSRAPFARVLLDAVAAGKIARGDITPYNARQMDHLMNAEVSKRLSEVWGVVATTSEQKRERIAALKHELSPDVMKQADLTAGRTVFTQTCAACHTLYDLGQQGANLGPNLTGSGRQDINYLLENIVDPSAIVPADYKLSTLTLKDGRVLSGFISTQTDQTLTLRTMTGIENLPRADVTKTEGSAQSLMPEGLLDALTPTQRRDLFGFLMKK